MNKILAWAQAIQHYEGFFPGSRSWRNCNPGNFKFTPYIKSLGAATQDRGGFAVFSTYPIGFTALTLFLTAACHGQLRSYKPTMTLNQFYEVYAPTSDNNAPHLYAKFVASQLGVDPAAEQIKTFLL